MTHTYLSSRLVLVAGARREGRLDVMPMPRLALIGVPSSAGGRRTGQEGAPAAFRAAGLLERLRERGLDVADLGDLPPVSFRPDPEHPQRVPAR